MTDKSLSEQICEVCGIKPKYKCKNVPCLNFMADSGICMLKDGFTKCNPETCEDDYIPDTNHRNWKEAEAVYPDFENNNNNFVKLLNLDFSPRFKSLLHYITSIFCSTNSTKDLLVQMLHELKFNSQSDTVKQIKQAIRQADWEY